MNASATALLNAAFQSGLKEVWEFVGTHLISGMIPAFFIAGAIAVFLEKERVTRLMGAKANPLIAYGIASFSGAILTVCSCGVIPIFSGILQRGAGIGPAFTFLFSAPAINLIALTYTFTYLGWKMALGRSVAVIVGAIVIGVGMRALVGENPTIEEKRVQFADDTSPRSDLQTVLFFVVLVLVMLTSTGALDRVFTPVVNLVLPADPLSGSLNPPSGAGLVPTASPVSSLTPGVRALIGKVLALLLEIILVVILARKWFHPDEITQWLKKSWSLFLLIFPKVLLGIFISGLIAAVLPLAKLVKWATVNTLFANFVTSLIGCTMYFGTIVGVNIVATLQRYGMHAGPVLTLLLAGPAISLPSVLALVPIVGRKKSLVFLTLVVVITTASGLIFGMLT